MREFTAVVERDSQTGFLVGYVPGFPVLIPRERLKRS